MSYNLLHHRFNEIHIVQYTPSFLKQTTLIQAFRTIPFHSSLSVQAPGAAKLLKCSSQLSRPRSAPPTCLSRLSVTFASHHLTFTKQFQRPSGKAFCHEHHQRDTPLQPHSTQDTPFQLFYFMLYFTLCLLSCHFLLFSSSWFPNCFIHCGIPSA